MIWTFFFLKLGLLDMDFAGEEEEPACMHAWSGPPFCPTKTVPTTVERSTGTDSVWLHVSER
jgi:hypothetical protein